MDLILVDGPNLFNVVGRVLERRGHKTWLAQYLTEWFDIDRLVRSTLELDEGANPGAATLGTVLFHSSKSLGRGSYYFDQRVTTEFWNRQGALPHTSAVLVEIPGVRDETCAHCGEAEVSPREKGVDTSITSYMFETAANWTTLCLFAKDADYVPPVLSLRRQGKRVFVSHDNIENAMGLVRACQSFVQLSIEFLEADAAMFAFLRSGGGLDQLIEALAPLGCSAQVNVPPPKMGAPMTAMFCQVLSVELQGTVDFGQIETKARQVASSIPGLNQEMKWEPGGHDMLPILVVGTRTLVGEGLDRHVHALGEAAWKRHIKPAPTL